MRVLNDYQGVTESQPQHRSGLGIGLALLFIGLGIGAVTALLYAPESGQKTRRKLRRRYEDAKDRINDWGDQANNLWERGSDWASNARDRVAEGVRPIRKAWK